MKPPPFEYEVPHDLDAALRLLAERGEEAKVLAGGQSLVPLMNFRLARPQLIVDINRLAGLGTIRAAGGVLRIGALTRQSLLERSPVVAQGWPLLTEAVRFVAHAQIRNQGTVGGSVAHADPAAELPCALAALDAHFLVRSVGGARRIPAAEFFLGPLETVLTPDELLVAIEVPRPETRSRVAFAEFARRHGDFALGGAAVAVTLDGSGACRRAAIGLLAAGPTPLRATAAETALVGRRITPSVAAEIAALAVEGVTPMGDMHGGTEYRRDVIEAMVRQALLAAVAKEVAACAA
jgi:carbon-monoxide dehydrogenase medium subunit/6-hydroxypseudooxynicotine dehydrogenase subunit alpha